jgi:hypothetical protein
MPLFISNSSHRYFAKVLGVFLLLSWATSAILMRMMPSHPWMIKDKQYMLFWKDSVIERYIREYRSKPIVITGSSICQEIPPEGLRPTNVATIYLFGSGGQMGLELMDRIGAAPKIALVEATMLLQGVDQDLLDEELRPWTLWWHRIFPAFSKEMRPTNLYCKWAYGIPQLDTPRAATKADILSWVARYPDSAEPNPTKMEQALAKTRRAADHLRSRGSRVIFFTPLSPELMKRPYFIKQFAVLRAGLRDYEWLPTPTDKSYYWTDGVHFYSKSGYRFFVYLMKTIEADSSGFIPNLLDPDNI